MSSLIYYLQNIWFVGKLQISALKTIAEYKGEGEEYVSCSFDPDDEDYVEGCVTLSFWKSDYDADAMVIVENSIFLRNI